VRLSYYYYYLHTTYNDDDDVLQGKLFYHLEAYTHTHMAGTARTCNIIRDAMAGLVVVARYL
jgi:hypothetical protein